MARLDISHRILVMRAALALLVVKTCLRVAPAWTVRVVSRRTALDREGSDILVARLIRAVRAIEAVPFLTSNCLSQSLTVLLLARSAGLGPTLVIGARRSGGRLAAHAWVECGGVAVGDQRTHGHQRLWAAS